ncbi:MAG: ABC transporter permease [Tepidisphaeraceae bacterium]
MTEAPAAQPPAAAAPKPVVRRSFMRQVMYDTFGLATARFGLVWIGLLVLAGVLAPLIASSHPIVMSVNGQWSSPLWRHLTGVDLILLAALLTFVVTLLARKLNYVDAFLAMLAVTVLVAPAASFKTAPDSVNYQQYRDLQRKAATDPNFKVWMLRTIVPYSPTDRLRDLPHHRLTAPFAAMGTLTRVDGKTDAGAIGVGKDGAYVVNEAGSERTIKAADVKGVSYESFRVRHWLGTETDGADLFSRMLHASRIALSVGIISTGIALTIGIFVGGLMGYYVGWFDLVGMRLVEIFEATPRLLLLISIMAAYAEWKSIYLMMAVIGAMGWTGTARFVRGEFLKLRNQDFVLAGIATGLRMSRVIYRHILPNALTPVLVTATFGVAGAIETEAVLSFLGLGVPDTASWGQMLNQARSGGQGFVWWLALFPGGAIFLTVFAYALIGDAMRDALDPKLRKRE